MSFSFKRASHWEVAQMMDEDYVLPDGCDLCRLCRRLPDGQVFAQIFVVNMEDRKAAAEMIRFAKQAVRERTDAEWVAGRDMVAEQDRA